MIRTRGDAGGSEGAGGRGGEGARGLGGNGGRREHVRRGGGGGGDVGDAEEGGRHGEGEVGRLTPPSHLTNHLKACTSLHDLCDFRDRVAHFNFIHCQVTLNPTP